MLSVRLLVFFATAVAFAPYTLQAYLDGCAFGKRVIAQVFTLGTISQDLFRLGSGAYTYPRTFRSLRANTIAPTAPPYMYGSDPYLGYPSMNTLVTKDVSTLETLRRRNGNTLRGSVLPLLSSSSLPNGNAGPAEFIVTCRPPSLELSSVQLTLPAVSGVILLLIPFPVGH